MKETKKYNNMIEAFECDINCVVEGIRKLSEMDVNDDAFLKDFHLLQELSFNLRHGKVKIMICDE